MQIGAQSLRSLPWVFVPGASADGSIELPQNELDRLRKGLRLRSGDELAVLPNDGTLIRCRLEGREAVPEASHTLETEARLRLAIAQALPKADRLETAVRMCTEIGVAAFVVFPADRSVTKWEEKKRQERLRRLQLIAKEAAERSYRTRIPTLRWEPSLKSVLDSQGNAIVLSESEGVPVSLTEAAAGVFAAGNELTLIVGPEGGWSEKECELIGGRAASLGPRVLRTDTAGPAAAAILLLGR